MLHDQVHKLGLEEEMTTLWITQESIGTVRKKHGYNLRDTGLMVLGRAVDSTTWLVGLIGKLSQSSPAQYYLHQYNVYKTHTSAHPTPQGLQVTKYALNSACQLLLDLLEHLE
jgi:hypothetical protein